MGRIVTLVCDGRAVRRFDNRAAGERCGTVYDGPVDSARVAGWRVGPARDDGSRPVMCPGCGRPGATEDEGPGPLILVPLPGL